MTLHKLGIHHSFSSKLIFVPNLPYRACKFEFQNHHAYISKETAIALKTC